MKRNNKKIIGNYNEEENRIRINKLINMITVTLNELIIITIIKII